MNGKSNDNLRDRFLKGGLSKEQELQFKKLISSSSSDEDVEFQQYYEWIETENRKNSESPFTKNEFFLKVEEKKPLGNIYVWSLIAAASISLLIVLKFNTADTKKKYSDEDIQQSYEVTRKALIAFSAQLEKNALLIDKGLDISSPFKKLNRLNNVTYSKIKSNDEFKQ